MLAIASACGSSQPRLDAAAGGEASAIAASEPTAGPSAATEGGVTVVADPYVQLERQRRVFDVELTPLGVLPVQLTLENRGNLPLVLHSLDLRLSLPGGERLSPADPSVVVVRLPAPSPRLEEERQKKSMARRFLEGAASGALGGLLTVTGIGIPVLLAQAAVEGGRAVVATPDGSDASSRAAAVAAPRGERIQAIAKRNITLGKGGVISGFVYFILPAGTAAFDVADLVAWVEVEDAGGGQSVAVDLPLHGLAFPGVEPDG